MRVGKQKRLAQLSLPFVRARSNNWGGARSGAGRKPSLGRRRVEHRRRGFHASCHPLHVVLRSKFRPLRSQFVFPTIRRALARATRARSDFRVVQFSVQHDHLHLIVEASGPVALSRGMQGLAIRVARAINRLTFRRGKFWSDRFFSRALTSPRTVRNALAYVLNNFRKHRVARTTRIDPYSSAPYFQGFRDLSGVAPCHLPASRSLPLSPHGLSPPVAVDVPVSPARTWLARRGWQRGGAIAFSTRGQSPA